MTDDWITLFFGEDDLIASEVRAVIESCKKLITARDMVGAVRLYREYTGASLAAARTALGI